MKLTTLFEACELLKPFYDDPSKVEASSWDEMIILDATDKPLNEETIQKMKDLGWFQVEGQQDDFKYDPSIMWKHYAF